MEELKNDFSTALHEDRVKFRSCGFITDYKLIWMVGVNITYFKNCVLRFDHKDFT